MKTRNVEIPQRNGNWREKMEIRTRNTPLIRSCRWGTTARAAIDSSLPPKTPSRLGNRVKIKSWRRLLNVSPSLFLVATSSITYTLLLSSLFHDRFCLVCSENCAVLIFVSVSITLSLALCFFFKAARMPSPTVYFLWIYDRWMIIVSNGWVPFHCNLEFCSR